MKTLILFIVLVILISIFATTNSFLVPIHLGSYVLNIPLSLALILPLGIGLLIFTLVYFTKSRRLRSIIKHDNAEIDELQNNAIQLNKKIHQLQIENNKLKTKLGGKSFDDESI